MITILVGNTHPDAEVDINFGTTWGEMLPREQVAAFDEFLENVFDPITIRVYNGTIINWIGEQIEQCNIIPHHVYIHTPNGGVHYFDSMGVIDGTWPYGIFNYA